MSARRVLNRSDWLAVSWYFGFIWNQNLQEIKGYYTRFLQLILANIRYLSIYINWLIVVLGWLFTQCRQRILKQIEKSLNFLS
jgi:hypothetical protein